jgi:hypothetical protein
MTFFKPLNVLVICATFAFLGAIVVGALGGVQRAPANGAGLEIQAAIAK